MAANLRALIGKLNAACRSAVEGAAGLCLSRTHYDIEIEHFLVKALDATDGDLAQILKHYGVNRSRLADDLARGLDRLKTGNARTPRLSPSLVKVLTEAWTIGSLEYGAPQVRTGHCVLALITNPELSRLAKDISREFEKIAPEVLQKEFVTVTAPSAEASAEVAAMPGGRAGESSSGTPKAGGKTANLDQFTVDLTARARAGKIDPVLGRDFEVRQVVDILTRRRQNNPILVGEAGVGKTAVVEGFARRVVEGDVPEPLKNVAIRTLDLALLQAGAGIKGEFENRLKALIEEVKGSPTPIILFIDEAHTMIGAGGQAGQNDAANLLKPALARGELRAEIGQCLTVGRLRVRGRRIDVRRLDPGSDVADLLDEAALLLPARGEPRQLGLQVGARRRDAGEPLPMVDAERRLALQHARLHGEIVEPPTRIFHRPRGRLLA